MNCVICNKEIVLVGDNNLTGLPISEYWSYDKAGERRPYCGVICVGVNYEYNLTHDVSYKYVDEKQNIRTRKTYIGTRYPN